MAGFLRTRRGRSKRGSVRKKKLTAHGPAFPGTEGSLPHDYRETGRGRADRPRRYGKPYPAPGGGGWVPPGPQIGAAEFQQQLAADMAYFGLSALPPDQPVCNCPANEQCGQQCGPFGHLCKWTCSGGDSGWSWKKIGKRI